MGPPVSGGSAGSAAVSGGQRIGGGPATAQAPPVRVKAAGAVFVAPLAATKPGVCQEAELSTYALLVSRHRHAIPAALFSFVPHTIATARGLLREAASSVGLTGGDIPPVPVDQGLFRVVRDLTWMAPRQAPPKPALYLHTDLSTWCTLFCGLVSASRRLPDVPRFPSSPTWSPGATGHRPRSPREPSGYSSTASPGERKWTASSIPPGSWGCSSNRTGPMSRTVHPLRGARTHRFCTGTAPQHQRQDPEAGAAGTVRRGGA